MWDLDKVLVVTLAHASLLLPERVLPDNDHPHPFLYQKVNDALTGGVQVMIDEPVARGSDAFHLSRLPLSILFVKLLLYLLHALIVPLVHRFYRTPVNKPRAKPL